LHAFYFTSAQIHLELNCVALYTDKARARGVMVLNCVCSLSKVESPRFHPVPLHWRKKCCKAGIIWSVRCGAR